MFAIGKSFAFSASHQLDSLPTGHKCTRLHGHNYAVEVCLAAGALDEYGFVADYALLDPVGRFLEAKWDHRHLNDVLDVPPTAENLAYVLYTWCSANLAEKLAERLVSVRVAETPGTWAEFKGRVR